MKGQEKKTVKPNPTVQGMSLNKVSDFLTPDVCFILKCLELIDQSMYWHLWTVVFFLTNYSGFLTQNNFILKDSFPFHFITNIVVS